MDASKVIVITGASDGIGAAAARPLAWSAAPVWQMVTTAAAGLAVPPEARAAAGLDTPRWMSCPWSGRVPRKWRAARRGRWLCCVAECGHEACASLAARPAARLSPSVLADASRGCARADGEQSMIIV